MLSLQCLWASVFKVSSMEMAKENGWNFYNVFIADKFVTNHYVFTT